MVVPALVVAAPAHALLPGVEGVELAGGEGPPCLPEPMLDHVSRHLHAFSKGVAMQVVVVMHTLQLLRVEVTHGMIAWCE